MCRSSQPRIFHSGFAILEIWLANSPRVPSMFLLALVETRDSELLKPTRKREPRAIRCRWGKNSSLRTARRCALFLFDCSRSETARHRETEREREREMERDRKKRGRERDNFGQQSQQKASHHHHHNINKNTLQPSISRQCHRSWNHGVTPWQKTSLPRLMVLQDWFLDRHIHAAPMMPNQSAEGLERKSSS